MMREITALLRMGLPGWLLGENAWATIEVFGDVLDDQLENARAAMQLRFPNYQSVDESLALIGDDRKTPRGLEEPAEDYAVRLRAWLDVHKRSGNAHLLVEQVAAFYFHAVPDGLKVKLVDRSGQKFTWEDGVITQSTEDMSDWDDLPEYWSRWFLYVYTAESGIVVDPVDAVRVPVIHKAQHVGESTITILPYSESVWDEPDLVWADDVETDDDAEWGDDTDQQTYEV